MSDEVSESKKMNILEITAGDDADIPIVFLNPENGQGIDCSGFTEIIFVARDKRGRKVIEKKFSASGIIYDANFNGDGTDGRFLLVRDKRDTLKLKGVYPYTLFFDDGTDETRPINSFINIEEAQVR